MNISKIEIKYFFIFSLFISNLFGTPPIDSNQTYYNNNKAINPFFLHDNFTTSDSTAAIFGTALIGILNYDIIKDHMKNHNQGKNIDFEFLKKVEKSIKEDQK